MGCGLGNFFLHDKHWLNLEGDQVGNGVKAGFIWEGGEEGFIHQEAFLGWNLEGNIGARVAGAPKFATWKVRLTEQGRDQTKSSTSGQRLSYLNCNPAFGLGNAGADLLSFYLKIFLLFYLGSLPTVLYSHTHLVVNTGMQYNVFLWKLSILALCNTQSYSAVGVGAKGPWG